MASWQDPKEQPVGRPMSIEEAKSVFKLEGIGSVPNPKLLPHMIENYEVPELITNEAHAEQSIARRLDKQIERDEKRKQTKFVAGAAAVAAAFAMLGKEAVDYNRSHPVKPAPIEHTGNSGFVNSGTDSRGNAVEFSEQTK